MNKIKVCYVSALGMEGPAIFLCNLLEHMDFNKYDVTVISVWFNNSDAIVSRLKKLPVKFVPCPTENTFQFCRFINRLFKDVKFDVFHSHSGGKHAPLFLIAWRNGVPVRVAHSHIADSRIAKAITVKGVLRRFAVVKIIFPFLRQLIRIFANRYLACGEEAAERLYTRSIISKKRYVVVPNGIDLEKFSCPDRTKHQRTEILFIGRFEPQKNPTFAVRAFSEYLKIDPTAHMTMIGKGGLNNDVRAEIERLNLSKRVDVVSETDETPKYYRAADLLLAPSLFEGMPIVLVEAQAAGVKCLVSDAITTFAQCGLVDYRPLDDGAAAWAEYMSLALQNDDLKIDRDKLNRFDINNTVRIIDEAYGL